MDTDGRGRERVRSTLGAFLWGKYLPPLGVVFIRVHPWFSIPASVFGFNNWEIRNNHIITRTTATPRKDGLFGFHPGGDFKTISIRVNVIEGQGQARPLLCAKESYGAVIQNNQRTNISDADRYDNARTDQRAGLEAPLKFECGVRGEFILDGW